VRVSAFNAIGYSDPSIQNQEGVSVQLAPTKPPADLIVNYAETSERQISLRMSPFTSVLDTGGSDIISYALYWDGGTIGNSFDVLIGEASNNI